MNRRALALLKATSSWPLVRVLARRLIPAAPQELPRPAFRPAAWNFIYGCRISGPAGEPAASGRSLAVTFAGEYVADVPHYDQLVAPHMPLAGLTAEPLAPLPAIDVRGGEKMYELGVRAPYVTPAVIRVDPTRPESAYAALAVCRAWQVLGWPERETLRRLGADEEFGRLVCYVAAELEACSWQFRKTMPDWYRGDKGAWVVDVPQTIPQHGGSLAAVTVSGLRLAEQVLSRPTAGQERWWKDLMGMGPDGKGGSCYGTPLTCAYAWAELRRLAAKAKEAGDERIQH